MKKYTYPCAEIISYTSADIITTSGNTPATLTAFESGADMGGGFGDFTFDS